MTLPTPSQGQLLPLGSAEGKKPFGCHLELGPSGASGAPGEERCYLSEPQAPSPRGEGRKRAPWGSRELFEGCGPEGGH